MSMDPAMISQMLMQKLQQPASAGSAGGGQGGPQMQGSVSPTNAAATLAQKAMLVRALQGGPTPQQMMQQHQANGMIPGTNAMMQADPTMQALQQTPQIPMQPMNPSPAIADPNAMPVPGVS
jgi:hypothetical protein